MSHPVGVLFKFVPALSSVNLGELFVEEKSIKVDQVFSRVS